MEAELCYCGLPLHYTDPEIQRSVERLVRELGTHTRVTVSGRTWLVPRHYIALHGLRAAELPMLGFEEIRSI